MTEPAPARSTATRAAAIALRVLASLAVIALGAWFVRGLHPRECLRALASADWLLVGAAAALNFVHLGFRTARFGVLLAPARRVPFARLYRYSLATCAGSNLLPARAGELVRIWLLKTHDGIAATTTVAAVLAEKGLDLAALLACAAPLPHLLPSLPETVSRTVSVLALAGAGVAVAVAVATRLGAGRSDGFLHRFAAGLTALRRPGPLALALGWSLAAWAADALEILLVAHAVGAPIPPAGALLVLLSLNLAIAVPSTPAQVGAFELGASAPLALLGVLPERALAFALLYHVMQALPTTLAGLPLLREVRRARPATGPAA